MATSLAQGSAETGADYKKRMANMTSLGIMGIMEDLGGYDKLLDERLGTLEAPTSDGNDIWASTGGSRAQVSEKYRLLAMTNPSGYSVLKNAAIEQVRVNTIQAGRSAYGEAIAAGLSIEDAKKHMHIAAKNSKELGFKTLELRFPSSDDMLHAKKLAREADAFKGVL